MKKKKLKKEKCEALKHFTKAELVDAKQKVYENVYEIEKGKKIYSYRRTGTCDSKKCNAACCKAISYNKHGGETNLYVRGFTDKETDYSYIMDKKCKYLKGRKCSIFKKKNFPNPCLQFPHLNDGMYLAVEDVCTFGFRFLGVRDA